MPLQAAPHLQAVQGGGKDEGDDHDAGSEDVHQGRAPRVLAVEVSVHVVLPLRAASRGDIAGRTQRRWTLHAKGALPHTFVPKNVKEGFCSTVLHVAMSTKGLLAIPHFKQKSTCCATEASCPAVARARKKSV